MINHPFWQISGIVFWSLLGIWVILRVLLGKDYLSKLGVTLLLGPGLTSAIKNFLIGVREKHIDDETLANLIAHITWRLTRIGLLGLLVTSIPIVLLWQQNKLIGLQNDLFNSQNELFQFQNTRVDTQTILLSNQNALVQRQTELLNRQDEKLGRQNELFFDQNRNIGLQTDLFHGQNSRIDSQIMLLSSQNLKIDMQNNLLEADRRSSLIFLMSNILDKVDEEIKIQRDFNSKPLVDTTNNISYSLSEPLIARIIALSRAFKPYRIYQNDTLSNKMTSPERGQLFIALMENNLDSATQNTIVEKGDFSYAQIGEINLSGSNLSLANLAEANFSGARLNGANLKDAILSGANLKDTDLRETDLRCTDLSNADLYGADLRNAKLSDAVLQRANLSGIDLTEIRFERCNCTRSGLVNRSSLIGFEHAQLNGADLAGLDLDGVSFYKAKLINANLKDAKLARSNFIETNLGGANLSGTNLTYALLSSAFLNGADLNGANLAGARLNRADLNGADLSRANLDRTHLDRAVLSNVSFQDTNNLTIEEFTTVKSLFHCKDLNFKFENQLRKEKPCLFTIDGCGNLPYP